jgi:hypothetical protein
MLTEAQRESFDRDRPRPFNLSDAAERERLMRETLGYARVSLHKKDGTDLTGREFAHDALKHALMMGYRLVPPGEVGFGQ